MKPKSLLLCLLICFFVTKISAQTMQEFYIINTLPSSVLFYNPENPNLKLIPIDENPTMALLEPTKHLLFILHDGLNGNNQLNTRVKMPKRPSSLSIINVANKEFITKIPLGWRAKNMEIINDSCLVIFGTGMPRKGQIKNDTERGFITVINTRNCDSIYSKNLWRWVGDVKFTNNSQRIIVFGADEFNSVRNIVYPWQHKISILSIKGDILSEISIPRLNKLASPYIPLLSMNYAFSIDQNWLYLLDPGRKHNNKEIARNSEILSIDLRSGKLAECLDLGSTQSLMVQNPYNGIVTIINVKYPTKDQIQISRLDSTKITQIVINSKANEFHITAKPSGIIAIEGGQLTLIPDTVDNTYHLVDLKTLGVGEILSFSQLPIKGRSLVFLLNNKYGIIDENWNKIINTGVIGREGVIAAKTFGNIMLSAGLGFTASVLSGNLSIVEVGTKPTFVMLEVRPDEEYIYILNTKSNDVTIINTENGIVLDKIPVGAYCSGISLTSDGKYILALSGNKLTVINTDINKIHAEIKIEKTLGLIKDLLFLDKYGNFAVLFENGFQLWDIDQGKISGEIWIRSKPEFFVFSPRNN